MHICQWSELWLVNTYMLIELWMCWWLHICRVTMNYWWIHIYAYMLVMMWWYCLCEHMHWVESYVHAYMTDGDGDEYLYPNVRRGVKSYIRCVCCIEGDDLEVIWYHMHLEESRTLHAFEWLVIIVELYIDDNCWIVYWW